MPYEIEIKLRLADLRGFREALSRLGARAIRCVHEWNELYDTPASDLKRRSELLRVRTESPLTSGGRRPDSAAPKTILTLKGPITGGEKRPKHGRKYKVREEIEANITDGPVLRTILRRMGLRIWFRYEKRRTTFRLPAARRWARDLLIELDETPMGSFIELEGPRNAIDRAATALGYGKPDYLTANYFVLYRDHCRRAGKKAGDMLFANKNGAPPRK